MRVPAIASLFCAAAVLSAVPAVGTRDVAEYVVATREGELTTLVYQTLAQSDASLIGVSTMAITADGVKWPSSQAFGRGVKDTQRMTIGTSCTNMNTMYELLVSAALVKLHQDTQFVTSIDEPIAARYSPFGIPIINPTTNVAVTYRHLMQHTSTITDIAFASYTQSTPATVMSLNAFVESYLTTGSGGVLQSNVFSTKEPGSPSAYNFARTNTAVVAYIINKIIAEQGLSYRGVSDYINDHFIKPMGLSSTFFLQQDGAAAKVLAPPSFSGTFAGVDSLDVNNYADYYQSCIADQDSPTVGVLIHPAFVSDYMVYTTASDVARMVYLLFLSSELRWTTVSNELRSVFMITQGTGRVPTQTGTGLSVMYFDGKSICDIARLSLVLGNCPLTNTSAVYGYVTSRDKVQTGFICSDTTRSGPLCVVNTLLYSSSTTRDTNAFMSLAAATFQDLVGDAYANAEDVRLAPTEKDEWFGVYVFLGVYGTLVVVYIITKIIIYWGLQISIAANTNTGGAAQLATPKKQSALD